MCGLVAGIARTDSGFNNPDVSKFTNLLIADSIRGPDSTGVFGVNKYGNVEYHKEKGNPFELINSKEYNEFRNQMYTSFRMVVGHNRKATIGEITDKNAHPFAEDHIILVHNGSLTTHKNLTDADVEVDSHAITHAIAKEGYHKALANIQGAFALIWYDVKDKAIRFVRNTQRPLWLMETSRNFWLVSEWEMASWILGREDNLAKDLTYQEVPPGIVHTVKLDDPKNIVTEEVEFYKPPPVNTHYPVSLLKKPQPQPTGGIKSQVRVGDIIVVNVITVVEFKEGRKFRAYLKAKRIVGDDTPVYISVTEDELNWYQESGENLFTCQVYRVTADTDVVSRIFANNLDEYEPEYDVTGNEVFLEEWNACKSHVCKRCGKPTFWTDIHRTFFKFKSESRNRIICPSCWEKGNKR